MQVQRRIFDFELLALPRDAYVKLPKSKSGNAEFTGATEGALSAKLQAPDTTVKKNRVRDPLNAYQVEIKDGKLIVTPIEPKTTGAAVWVGGLFLSAGFILFGLRIAKYVWRKVPHERGPVVTIAPPSPA